MYKLTTISTLFLQHYLKLLEVLLPAKPCAATLAQDRIFQPFPLFQLPYFQTPTYTLNKVKERLSVPSQNLKLLAKYL